MNALESLGHYFNFDKDQGLEDDASIIGYFESLGGYEILCQIQSSHSNSNVQSLATAIFDTFFNPQEQVDDLFSHNY